MRIIAADSGRSGLNVVIGIRSLLTETQNACGYIFCLN